MPGKAEWRIDGVLLGTLAGMAGALAKDAPNFILRALGVLKSSYWEMAASTLLAPEQAQTPGGLFIGAAADLLIGGVLGIIMLAVFSLFGRDLWWYKGMICGNVIWLLGTGLILGLVADLPWTFSLVFRLSSLFDHQLFGVITTYVIWRWSGPGSEKA